MASVAKNSRLSSGKVLHLAIVDIKVDKGAKRAVSVGWTEKSVLKKAI